MMYSGMTLTIAPLTLTMCGAGLQTGSPRESVNSAAVSRPTDAPTHPDAIETGANGASRSLSIVSTLSTALPSSVVSTANDGTQAISSVSEISSSPTTAIANSAVNGSACSFAGSMQPAMSLSASGISE